VGRGSNPELLHVSPALYPLGRKTLRKNSGELVSIYFCLLFKKKRASLLNEQAIPLPDGAFLHVCEESQEAVVAPSSAKPFPIQMSS